MNLMLFMFLYLVGHAFQGLYVVVNCKASQVTRYFAIINSESVTTPIKEPLISHHIIMLIKVEKSLTKC